MNITNTETGEVTSLELQSQEINELAKALAKAQGLMTSAQKDRQNPFFKSSYATLDSVWQAIRKPLADNGLSVVQVLLPDNTLVTILLHESGQWLHSYLRLNPAQDTPQGIGSALTYARRYSLAAIAGISQADDDGEEASQPAARTTNKKQELEAQPKPQAELPKASNGKKVANDPMTQFWLAIAEKELTKQEGQRILSSVGGDAVKAIDALTGFSQPVAD